ncbi:exopolysaccharide biosynthesis protein [Mannheimia granulomatis]|uniref:DUF4422 domain-containing protein n=1 Tax=Mannheimia granulomatis TaxID=85402 RepID=UPI00159E3182|nr:DUF4422 domain-containing protein [Mannheimia granulomatis]QLB15461.1 exopolysaccharide biosynthesis protein [Mannheimia granulomatis]
MTKTTILVAAHKAYQFPENDIYIPIQVGKILATQDLGLLSDAEGENISDKNPTFCELTALYWAWQNGIFEKNDYVGLVHYRRYFKGEYPFLKNKYILSEKNIQEDLSQVDCLVPKKRKYYIETVYSHYKNAHYINDLDLAVSIIIEKNPEYLTACNTVLDGSSLHLFNMFIMRSELCGEYCEWLFSILFELEKRIDISSYSIYQKRVFGFVSERLFNIWIEHNHIKIKMIDVVNIENENFLLKAINLLKRKFLNNEEK